MRLSRRSWHIIASTVCSTVALFERTGQALPSLVATWCHAALATPCLFKGPGRP